MDILPDNLPNNYGYKLLGQLKPPRESNVCYFIKKLPSKWSAGPEDIPCTIVKECANILVYPLTIFLL